MYFTMDYLLIATLILSSRTSYISANEDLMCQSVWHKYHNKCYWFSDLKKTRDESKLVCESLDSTLVTIDREQISTFLKQHTTENSTYWIGLRMSNVDADAWRWNTGDMINTTLLNWCADTTTPTTACAVMFYDGESCLKSYLCTEMRLFFCEKEKMSTCPENWDEYPDEYSVGTPRCYYKSTHKATRMEAAKYCWNSTGRLVTVLNDVTKQYLEQNRLYVDNVHWVGISPYRWDVGTAYDWNNWDTNGPHIGDQCTRLLSSGMWTYGHCSTVYHFICEKEATIPVSTTGRSTVGIITDTFTTYSKTASHFTSSLSNHPTTTSYIHVTSISAIPGESVFTTAIPVPVKRFTSLVYGTDTYEAKTKDTVEKVTKKYLIIFGIMSAVTTCSLGAVVGLAIYIKRKTVPKQQSPASQGVQYEDVSSAYYNVGADINKSCDVKIYVNKDALKDENSDEQQQNETYEELTTVGVQKAEPGPYAVLK